MIDVYGARVLFLFLSLLVVSGCEKEAAHAPKPLRAAQVQDKEVLVDTDDPVQCAPCHGAVFKEWSQSVHSRSHHSKNAVYQTKLAEISQENPKAMNECSTCHAPRAPDEPDSYIATQGVSCAACHNVEAVHLESGKVGSEAIKWAEPGKFRSGRDVIPNASPVHNTGDALPEIKDGKTLCLACHSELGSPHQVPHCKASKDSPQTPCNTCHMPEVAGPHGTVSTRKTHKSHAFSVKPSVPE